MRKGFTEEEVAAMRRRLNARQEERRAIADVDALVRIVGASSRPQTIGVIVPIEEARDFVEFQKAKKLRGNWQETAVMAVAAVGMLAASFFFAVG